MNRPKLLDLFCGGGGAAVGYYRAGFDVVGVDIKPQPHYPFPFILGDALDVLRRMILGEKFLASDGRWYGLADFVAIHASPPCQGYSVMTNGRWQDRVKNHPRMIGQVRELLVETSKPYVIENVEGARAELINPILLCGTMFGLETPEGNQLLRHRYFECSNLFILVSPCKHNNYSAVGVYGGGQNPARKKARIVGVYGHSGGCPSRAGTAQFGVDVRRQVMGIDWMTNDELSEAIPPAYTEFIGKQLVAMLTRRKDGNTPNPAQ